MKKWKEKRTMGPKNIKWWKCKDEMMVEYREKVRRKYEELDAEKGTVEGEWRQYKDAFVGVAEELCGRTSGKGGTPRSRNQGWWTEEVAKAVGEKWEAWKMIEGIRDRGELPPTGLRSPQYFVLNKLYDTYRDTYRVSDQCIDDTYRIVSSIRYTRLLDRVLDARISRRVEGDFGEEQQGFRKGRGTADGMYVLR